MTRILRLLAVSILTCGLALPVSRASAQSVAQSVAQNVAQNVAQTSSAVSGSQTQTPAKAHPVAKPKTGTKGASAGTAKKAAPATKKTTTAPVPVVAPRHAGPPRHAPPVKKLAVHKPAAPPPPPVAAPPPAPPAASPTVAGDKPKLPRYASLKSDEVNMRVGPALRYPIAWTYKRRELPVRIEREYDIWRQVEDMDGIKGWVHEATLTGRRTFVIIGAMDRTMRADASETADAVAVLKPGVVGRILSCEAGKDWCQVQVEDYRGWLRRTDVWGVDAGEVVP